MTKQKSTKKTLLTSVLSLILCMAMLIGTTFAWFTDSVTSGNNIIQSGNLDVELWHCPNNQAQWGHGYDEAKGTEIEGDTALFLNADGKPILWEPGAGAGETFRVKNAGSLALKFKLNLKTISATKTPEGKDLTDILNLQIIELQTLENGAPALADDGVYYEGLFGDGYIIEGELLPGETADFNVAIDWIPSANDNDYNVAGGLEISFAIDLLATQLTYEKDSWDDQYDKNATYIPAWDGSVGNVPSELDNIISISTPAEMAAFATSVNNGNSYSGKTVKLTADINLDNKLWTPIGACNSATYFQGTFDGQGHTIYGLNVNKANDTYQYTTAGLFGWIDAASATIQNVKIDGATVKGSHWVGGIAGYMTGNIINCSVINSTIIGYNVNDDANGDKVGGIVGYVNSGDGSLKGNTVSNCDITAYRDVAGIAGAVATNNSIKNNTVKNTNVTYEADYAAAIVSAKTAVVVDDTNKAENVIVKRIINYNSAMGSLYDTIAGMNNGDILVIAGGTYNTSGTFQVPAGVTIKGKEGETVIIHQLSEGQDNIFNCAGDVTVQNITFETNRKGYAITDSSKNHDTDGDITVIGCKFVGLATEKNWGIYKNLNGNLTIKGCSFDNYNNAICGVNNGNGSTTVVTDCTFTNINGEAIGYVSSSLPSNFEAEVIANNTGLTAENVIGY